MAMGLSAIIITFPCLFFGITKGDIYAATTQLEDLVLIEQKLLNITKDYLQLESRKLDGLKQFFKNVERSVKVSSEDPSTYVGNPINSYLLLKRFTSGWRELEGRLNESDNKLSDIGKVLKTFEDYIPKYEEDFIGGVAALFRLQDTFGYTAREISDGKIKGISASPHQFTAEDCLEIGILALRAKRHVLMVEWIQEAYRIIFELKDKQRAGNVAVADILEHLAWGYYMSEDYENAARYSRELLRVEPDNESVLHNLKYYTYGIKNKASMPQSPDQFEYKEDVTNARNFWNSHYAKACRRELPPIYRKLSHLTCFYSVRHVAHIIQPVKTERVSEDPEILIFHNVLSNNQINTIKEISKPELRMAEVFQHNTGRLITAGYRISKSAWLFYHPNMSLTVIDIDRKSEQLTGLTATTAEELQIVNYGLGGQYEFHKDHGEPGSPLARHRYGNRIATLLYYLSDVEAGGITAFTKVGAYMKPQKGDAVFWYNLHRNGTGDWRTEHASCPVISGSKWVMNKWFHTYGNEFRRPCSLNRYE